jgi:hypothetical protein
MTGFCNTQYLPHALHRIMRDFYNLKQGKHRSNQEYYEEFKLMVLTAADSGATIGAHPGAINEVLNTTAGDTDFPTTEEHDVATKTATNRYLAIAFLLGAHKVRYGTRLSKKVKTNIYAIKVICH